MCEMASAPDMPRWTTIIAKRRVRGIAPGGNFKERAVPLAPGIVWDEGDYIGHTNVRVGFAGDRFPRISAPFYGAPERTRDFAATLIHGIL